VQIKVKEGNSEIILLRIAYHEAVHTGQLLSYLRTLGLERPMIWTKKINSMQIKKYKIEEHNQLLLKEHQRKFNLLLLM